MYTKITEANRSVRLERVSPRPPALRRISCLVAGSVAKTSPRATAAKNRSACSARGGGLTLDALAVCWPRARMVDAAPVAEERSRSGVYWLRKVERGKRGGIVKRIPTIVFMLGGVLVGPQSMAHHSFGAEYDVQKPIT